MNKSILKSFFLIFSITLNAILLNIKFSYTFTKNQSINYPLIVKLVEATNLQSKQIEKKRKKITNLTPKKLALNMLGVSTSRTLIISQEPGFDKNPKTNTYKIGSGVIEIFSRIDDRLNYPTELMGHNQQGIVKVRLYFDEKGYYHERHSRFQTNNNYLKVHVARILRAAFNKPLPSHNELLGSVTQASTTFYFHLSTGLDPGGDNGVTHEQLSFYRHGYGGDTLYDKIHQNTPSLPNLLTTLYKYRPNFLKSEKNQVQEFLNNKKLESYKDDPVWEM